MRIAVASGKGGTGKTTIATSLALSLAGFEIPPIFLDGDVEAPNAHLFLSPAFEQLQEVAIQIPQVDESKCTYCGKCAEACQYHAIVMMGKKTLVFPQLCHGCVSCALVCPEHAICETPQVIGVLERGSARSNISFARGVLNIGEPMAVPVIRQLKQWVQPRLDQLEILDAPPGTSCPVVESMRGADFILLVTEPTPFGLHDLRLAVQVAHELKIPVGVVINRDGIGDQQVDEFCQSEGLPILMRVPFERAIAQGVAKGKPLVDIHPEYVELFQQLFMQIAALP
ncbi:MAG: (4Fe-4S)-binding protein [Chloroflexi bacterium]|nr:MAG: (4Fe-4S)-binding protein [Chloroflexota bacterium]